MELIIPIEVLKLVKNEAISDHLKGLIAAPVFKGYQTTDSSDLDIEEYAILRTAAREIAATEDESGDLRPVIKMCRGLANKCATLVRIMKDDGSQVYSNLKHLTEALIKWVKGFPNGYVFAITEADDMPLPYVVTSITHTPGYTTGHGDDAYYVPAQISLGAEAIRRGSHVSETGSITEHTIPEGATVSRALALMGFVPENEDLIQSYKESLHRYGNLRTQTGILLVATGSGETKRKEWYLSDAEVVLGVEGKPAKVIMDDEEDFGDDTPVITFSATLRRETGIRSRRSRFSRHVGTSTTDPDVEGKETKPLPIHPFVRIFYFTGDIYVEAHINTVQEYIFDRRAFEKVVLPEDTKTMIDSVVRSAKRGDDIIAGKGKGIVVMSSGPAGTGKTLTAESYAERSRRPLYSIQCSQLGTDAEDLEKNLGAFLTRCRRWNAIGLLDEADVFVRERGNDINQNAIVGVFLRILEYYEGVLFLTTNREHSIDDAVLSRCLLHIRYTVPELEGMKKVWGIMFEQFKLVDEAGSKSEYREMIDDLAGLFLGCSPRTVKQLCRLAATMVDLGKALSTNLFLFVAKFKDLEREGTMLLDDLEKKEKRASLKKPRAVLKED
jgi:hypothetical protein